MRQYIENDGTSARNATQDSDDEICGRAKDGTDRAEDKNKSCKRQDEFVKSIQQVEKLDKGRRIMKTRIEELFELFYKGELSEAQQRELEEYLTGSSGEQYDGYSVDRELFLSLCALGRRSDNARRQQEIIDRIEQSAKVAEKRKRQLIWGGVISAAACIALLFVLVVPLGEKQIPEGGNETAFGKIETKKEKNGFRKEKNETPFHYDLYEVADKQMTAKADEITVRPFEIEEAQSDIEMQKPRFVHESLSTEAYHQPKEHIIRLETDRMIVYDNKKKLDDRTIRFLLDNMEAETLTGFIWAKNRNF